MKTKTYRIYHDSRQDTVQAYNSADALQFWITTLSDGGTYKFLGRTAFGDRSYRVTYMDGSESTVSVVRA